MEIGTAVQGLTAVLALNPWALLITGVVASGAIIYKTWSDTQARLEHDYDELRRKALQKDLSVERAPVRSSAGSSSPTT